MVIGPLHVDVQPWSATAEKSAETRTGPLTAIQGMGAQDGRCDARDGKQRTSEDIRDQLEDGAEVGVSTAGYWMLRPRHGQTGDEVGLDRDSGNGNSGRGGDNR